MLKITVREKLWLYEVPAVLMENLTSVLRLPNPKYNEAVMAGRSLYGINPFIINFTVLSEDCIIIPRGMLSYVLRRCEESNIPYNLSDERLLHNYIYIDSSHIKFKDYQLEAASKLANLSSGVLVSPAGSGKTVMGMSLIPMTGQPTLWLTHTTPLARQAKERAEKFLPSIGKIGMLGSGKWELGETLTIGMIQTLVRRLDNIDDLREKFGMVIVDECLVAGTRITMLDGSEKNIEDVVDGEVTTFGKVSNKFERETDSVVRLRGNWGAIEGTPTHRLPFIPHTCKTIRKNTYLPFNEKQVVMGKISEISKNDYLLICENTCHTVKHEIGPEKSRLLALIACDGHIEKNLRCFQVGVIKDKEWFINEMNKNTSIVNSPMIKTSLCHRGDIIIRSYSKELISFLSKYIPSGKKRDLHIPSVMNYATMNDIKNFLQVVFDTEGGLNGNQITITMATPEFLIGIQYLLRKFGIIARVVPINNKVTVKGTLCKNYLRLALSGYDAFLFYKKIGFSIERKQTALLDIVKKTKKFVRRVSYMGVDYRCVPVLHREEVEKTSTVYDFTTEGHMFIANGVLSSNCHHVPSRTFLEVIGKFNSYYTYGLTATPDRRDGLQDLMYQSIGVDTVVVPVARVAESGGVMMPLIKCVQISGEVVDGNDIQRILKKFIIENDRRNNIIVQDVKDEAAGGHFCIVISDRRDHCEILYNKIKAVWPKTGIATGKYSKAYVAEQVEKYNNNEITVLIATSSLLGEGFDVPFLDRAFITMPFRSNTKTTQIIGRIQRTHKMKKDAVVYDYLDVNIGVVMSQFSSKTRECRLNTYSRLGTIVMYV